MLNEFISFLDYSREILVGICLFVCITSLHIKIITELSLMSDVKTISDLREKNYKGVIRTNFILCLLLGFSHILSVFIWSGFLFSTDMIPSFISAILFAGSCYTTLGYMGDQLPIGWRLLALFIAINGLFSFALSTSVLLSKTNHFKIAWKERHRAKIIRYLKKHKLTEEDFENL